MNSHSLSIGKKALQAALLEGLNTNHASNDLSQF
jgi:hypothetical protein